MWRETLPKTWINKTYHSEYSNRKNPTSSHQEPIKYFVLSLINSAIDLELLFLLYLFHGSKIFIFHFHPNIHFGRSAILQKQGLFLTGRSEGSIRKLCFNIGNVYNIFWYYCCFQNERQFCSRLFKTITQEPLYKTTTIYRHETK